MGVAWQFMRPITPPTILIKQAKVFISFALPGEAVLVKMTNSKKNFEEGDALQVVNHPHSQRQTPPCPHFGVCGGCSLQHWQADAQIDFKQSVLKRAAHTSSRHRA